jgi:hypothetical protein
MWRKLAAGAGRRVTRCGGLLKTCLEQRFREVLMVRTDVWVIELCTCGVPMFKARRVIGRPGL